VKSLLGITTPGKWISGDEIGPVSDNLKQDVVRSISWLIDELLDSNLDITM